MKNIVMLLTIFCFLCFVSCNKRSEKEGGTSKAVSSLQNKNASAIELGSKANEINDNILKQIEGYYKKEYAKCKIEETDSVINMYCYHLPSKDDDAEYVEKSVYIPRLKDKKLFSMNTFLEGDLNNDKMQDVIIGVHHEGGGNMNWGNDLFIFKKETKGFVLSNVISTGITCDGNGGNFYPNKIEDGYLVGSSSCYDAEVDYACCPSLNYWTKAKLVNNQLSYETKFMKKT